MLFARHPGSPIEEKTKTRINSSIQQWMKSRNVQECPVAPVHPNLRPLSLASARFRHPQVSSAKGVGRLILCSTEAGISIACTGRRCDSEKFALQVCSEHLRVLLRTMFSFPKVC